MLLLTVGHSDHSAAGREEIRDFIALKLRSKIAGLLEGDQFESRHDPSGHKTSLWKKYCRVKNRNPSLTCNLTFTAQVYNYPLIFSSVTGTPSMAVDFSSADRCAELQFRGTSYKK